MRRTHTRVAADDSGGDGAVRVINKTYSCFKADTRQVATSKVACVCQRYMKAWSQNDSGTVVEQCIRNGPPCGQVDLPAAQLWSGIIFRT